MKVTKPPWRSQSPAPRFHRKIPTASAPDEVGWPEQLEQPCFLALGKRSRQLRVAMLGRNSSWAKSVVRFFCRPSLMSACEKCVLIFFPALPPPMRLTCGILEILGPRNAKFNVARSIALGGFCYWSRARAVFATLSQQRLKHLEVLELCRGHLGSCGRWQALPQGTEMMQCLHPLWPIWFGLHNPQHMRGKATIMKKYGKNQQGDCDTSIIFNTQQTWRCLQSIHKVGRGTATKP